MIQPICKDTMFLSRPSVPAEATSEDKKVIQDLKDTLKANREGCVGMAANMIGVNKRIIIVNMGLLDMIMVNPVIVSKKGPYEAEEGCLSLIGMRKCTRYESIQVEFLTEHFEKRTQEFSGWIAEIIQHECDHLEGIII